MAQRLPNLAGACLVAAALLVAPAAAQSTGGAQVEQDAGGVAYGAPLRDTRPPAPVARAFAVTPARLRSPELPALRLRLDQRGARTVRARVVFWPVGGQGRVARLDLGRVRTGRTLRPRLPKGFTLVPGRYVVRVHARGLGRRTLARPSRTPGRAPLTVLAPPPPPKPPPPPPVAAPPPSATDGPVFPVRGPHSLPEGGRFGTDRGDHVHEGQDISAAEGVPVVAPVAGTVSVVDVQDGGAGTYVVLDGEDGRAYFFAHLVADSVPVARGAVVAAGAVLGAVGSTGRSSGPHLHFEIWVGGWRTTQASRPIDPLPELRAWDR